MITEKVTDGNGIELNKGDRVATQDWDGKIVYGTLLPNDGFEEVAEWYVAYDDGQECAVLDFKQLFKA